MECKPSIVEILGMPPPIPDPELKRMGRAQSALLNVVDRAVKVEELGAKEKGGEEESEPKKVEAPILTTLHTVRRHVWIHGMLLGDLQFGRPDIRDMAHHTVYNSIKEYERQAERVSTHLPQSNPVPATSAPELRLSLYDLDGDGKLSPTELAAQRRAREDAARLQIPVSAPSR
jgi:hypothetical protein